MALIDGQRELQALRKQVNNGARHLKKGYSSTGIGQSQKLLLISKLIEQNKPLRKCKLCDLFGVVRSSYYYGIQTKPVDVEHVKLKALIRQVFNESKQSTGTRTIIGTLTLPSIRHLTNRIKLRGLFLY